MPSYLIDWRMKMEGYVQWNPSYGEKNTTFTKIQAWTTGEQPGLLVSSAPGKG